MTEFALLNARLLDLDAECPTPPTTVLVRGSRIAANGAPAPAEMQAHDLAGRTLMPGMIDGPDLVIRGKGLSMTGGNCDIRARTDTRPHIPE